MQCEFCDELHGSAQTRFQELYGRTHRSRIIASTEHFVALPTLGQLVPMSILVLPKEHFETFAQLPGEQHQEAAQFLADVALRLERFGEVFTFEHGSHSSTRGGCGIYHAHTHLLPLPSVVAHQDLLHDRCVHVQDLPGAWPRLASVSEYLLSVDSQGNVRYSVPEDESFVSQHARKRIVERFELDRPWDWRAYSHAEPEVLRAIASLNEAPSLNAEGR